MNIDKLFIVLILPQGTVVMSFCHFHKSQRPQDMLRVAWQWKCTPVSCSLSQSSSPGQIKSLGVIYCPFWPWWDSTDHLVLCSNTLHFIWGFYPKWLTVVGKITVYCMLWDLNPQTLCREHNVLLVELHVQLPFSICQGEALMLEAALTHHLWALFPDSTLWREDLTTKTLNSRGLTDCYNTNGSSSVTFLFTVLLFKIKAVYIQ